MRLLVRFVSAISRDVILPTSLAAREFLLSLLKWITALVIMKLWLTWRLRPMILFLNLLHTGAGEIVDQNWDWSTVSVGELYYWPIFSLPGKYNVIHWENCDVLFVVILELRKQFMPTTHFFLWTSCVMIYVLEEFLARGLSSLKKKYSVVPDFSGWQKRCLVVK